MYREFYSLKKKPFEITTDPRFLWLGEQHREALATLEYGIREEKGFLLLTGDVGSGKTVLIHALAKTLNIQSFISSIPDPGLSLLDFYNALADSLKMNRRFASKGEFLVHLKNFLLKADAVKRRVLLIIDEAQRLNHELLEEIRLLSNIELDERKLINIFFVGQPEFNDLLRHPRGKAVLHRIVVRYHIEPLEKEELEKYINHRLKIAGATRKVFTAEAVSKIYEFSEGNPRLTNIICDRALLTGYSEEQKTIDTDVIEECMEELRIPGEPPIQKTGPGPAPPPPEPAAAPAAAKPARRSFSFVTAFLVVCCTLLFIGGGYYLLTRETPDTARWSMDEIAPQQPKLPDRTELQQLPPAAAAPKTGPASISQPPASPPAAAPPEPAQPSQPEQVPTPATAATQAPSAPPPQQPAPVADNPPAAPQAPPAPEAAPIRPPDLAKVEKIVIYFKHNSNELSDQEFRTLDRFAAALKESPAIDVVVKGYTDSSGAFSYNMSVSQFRANLIKSYLVGKGIGPSRITAVGLGPQDPIASNDTAEGRSLNRRVEIEFIAKNSESITSN
jgi:general secretion pathway protein A